MFAAAAAKSLQSCPTLCNPGDGSPPGSPVPGILQARTLEWAVISFSNAWKWNVKVKSLSCVRLLARRDLCFPCFLLLSASPSASPSSWWRQLPRGAASSSICSTYTFSDPVSHIPSETSASLPSNPNIFITVLGWRSFSLSLASSSCYSFVSI